MRTVSLMIAGLLLFQAGFVAQESPPSKRMVQVDFEAAQLDEVFARMAKQLGYKVLLSKSVDPDTEVTMVLGAVSPEVAFALLAHELDLAIELHSDRKLIEVDEEGGGYTFYGPYTYDITKLSASFYAANAVLGPPPKRDAELPPARESDCISDLRTAMHWALGLEPRHTAGVGDAAATCWTKSRERVELEELIGLLSSDGGGQSTWLKLQSETWKKMKESQMVLAVQAQTLSEVVAVLSEKLAAPFLISRELLYSETDTCSLDLPELTFLDTLRVVCRQYHARPFLIGNVVYLVRDDDHLSSYPQIGYAVYNVAQLIEDLKTKSAVKSDTLGRDLRQQVMDLLETAILNGDDSDIGPVDFGTRILVRGDMQVQEIVQKQLIALGWKPS